MREKITLTMLCLATLGVLAAPGLAQDYRENKQLPEGAIGERIQGLLDVINANNPERAQAFIESTYTEDFLGIAPMEEHLAIVSQIWEQSRGYDFYGVREYLGEAPTDGTVVIVRNRLTKAWTALVFAFEPDPPHRIDELQIMPARPPAELEADSTSLSDDQIVAALETFVQRLAEADAFSGTVLLARDGKPLYTAAHGLASKRFDVPNALDTKFNLGSMNKMFTGVAVMQLVESGKLALDDPLSKYVGTDWLPAEITDKIQIQHLLTHTSGLGSYFNETFMESSRLRFRELADYKPLVKGETLAFEPGTDTRYSNTGMFLAGVVIEAASGENYFDYIRSHVYAPAGMTNSDCYDMDRPVPNLAIGYTKEGGEWRNNLYLHVVRGGPAGGGFSTVEDLLRFDQALRTHTLLSVEGSETLWSAKPELGSPEYGFGFGVGGTPDDRIVGHSGGFPGINSNLDVFVDSGYTAAVMSNYDRGAMPIVQKIQELIAARAR
jgi:CubicO group peptidase (beta-lactamase class C family)